MLENNMSVEKIDLDHLPQLQQLFGVNDEFLKLIEKELSIHITQRNSTLSIYFHNERQLTAAKDVLKSMQDTLNRNEVLNKDVVLRFLESSINGSLEKICNAMKINITTNYQGKPISPKTIGQHFYLEEMKKNQIVTCIGPAGTGKTYLAVAYAAEELKKEHIQKIILSRPAIEAGERLGFLPGDLEQKVDPYLRPLYDALNDIFGVEGANRRREKGEIEIAPLAYMRGRTLSNSIIIIDEAQNATLSTLKMALTRIGQNSKMILTGDITQVDLFKTDGKESGLQECANIISEVEGVSNVYLHNQDVVRCKIVRDIVKAFETH